MSRVSYSEHTAHVGTHALTSCGRAWRVEARTAGRGIWWYETYQAAFLSDKQHVGGFALLSLI